MNLRKTYLLIIFSVATISSFAQENPLKSEFKFELGINRSELLDTRLKTEIISGGVGWSANVLYNLQKGVFFGETGLGFRSMNLLISEDLSGTEKFTARGSSINIPLLVGTNFIKGDHKVLPILKTGINLDYTVGFSTLRTDILTKSDIKNANITYVASAGVRLNKLEILLSYNADLNNYIKTINKRNNYVGFKLAYYF
jgi:hypothetical protein